MLNNAILVEKPNQQINVTRKGFRKTSDTGAGRSDVRNASCIRQLCRAIEYQGE